MLIFRRNLLCAVLLLCLFLAPALADAATGMNYLGEVCLVLDVGPRMLKLSLITVGPDYFSVTGKMTDGLQQQPVNGSGVVTYQQNVASVTITMSTSNMHENISSVFTLSLGPTYDYGYYAELRNERLVSERLPADLVTEMKSGDFSVVDCSYLKL